MSWDNDISLRIKIQKQMQQSEIPESRQQIISEQKMEDEEQSEVQQNLHALPQTLTYFHNFQKDSQGIDLAQKAIKNKIKDIKQDILEGKYQIKKRKWPEKPDSNQGQKLDHSVFRTKKQLEEQLANIESRLSSESEQKAPKELTQQERLAFLKKMEQQKRQLLQKKKEAARLEEENRIQQQKKARQEQERAEEEKKNKKRQQLAEKLRILQQNRKLRLEQHHQQQTAFKQKLAEKTMADKMESQYIFKQNQFLEEKKKRLAQIRNIHKPIDRNQLDTHSQKYHQLQQLRAQAAKSRNRKNSESASVFYKSAFYKQVEKEERMSIDLKHEEELLRLKQARDRLKRFSEHVRNDYKPSIDEKKAEELKFRSEGMKKRAMSVNQTENQRKLGLRYLEYSKLKVENHKLLASEEKEKEEDSEEKKKIDYLAELRQRNKNAQHSAQGLIESLQKKGYTQQEKAKKIMQYSSRIELKAKRQEQLKRLGGGMSQQLDDLYLEAIEAKLSLLDV